MNVKSMLRAGGLLSAALLALCTTAAAQQLKTWRHGVLEAKSDAELMLFDLA